MCIIENVDNVDNFVEKNYLQPETEVQKTRNACKIGKNG